MHILIIPSWYPSPEEPVSGIFVQEQAKALKKAGHRVGVIYPFVRRLEFPIRKKRRTPFGFNKTNEFNLKVYRYDTFPLRLLSRCKNELKIILGDLIFQRYLKENGTPDVLHAHTIFPGGLIAARLKYKHNIPAVLTEHHSEIGKGRIRPWQIPKIKKCLKYIDVPMVVSPVLEHALAPYYDTAYIWMPNLVDIKYFTPADPQVKPRKISLSKEKFIFLSIGILTRNKGIHLLIKAFALAFKDMPVELWIVGDGTEKQNLMVQSQAMGVSTNVKFFGLLNREKIRDTLRRCDTLVLPSLFETFGVVLIEAFSCGKPVIASRCGGPEYIVNQWNGDLVPKGNVLGLAQAMTSMIKNYHRYNPYEIRKSCIANFGEKQIVSKLERIYKHAAKRTRQ